MVKTGSTFIDFHSGEYQGTPVVCQVSEDECFNVISHTPNPDGYIRKCFRVNGKKVLKMYHRFVWERSNGEIPKGYEVDHKCRNRKCCNPLHLQLLTRSEHKTKTNKERYQIRIEGIKFALSEGFTVKSIAEAFGVTDSTVRRHKR